MTTAAPSTLDRRGAWILVGAGSVVTVVLGGVLVPWDWVPGGTLHPANAGDLFSSSQLARMQDFSDGRRWLGWASLGVSLLVACGLGFSPLGARLLGRVAGKLPWWLGVPVGVAVLLLIGRVATLPIALLIRRHLLDYGLTRQGFGGWAADQLRSLVVSWVIATLLVLVVVGSARRSPRRWFLGAAGMIAGLSIVGSFLYPVVVEPLFNRFTPLPDGPFKTSVLRLADREGVHVDEVLVADASRRTTTVNAYVSGLGASRRVVLYDTLLQKVPPAEARVIVAHELGHAKNHDVLVGTLLATTGGVAGVGLLALLLDSRRLQRMGRIPGLASVTAVATVLALMAVGQLLSSPAVNAVSRAVETRADREALAATGEGRVFVEMQRRLALESLQDPTPPALSQWWFGSHPTVLQRAGLPASMRGSN